MKTSDKVRVINNNKTHSTYKRAAKLLNATNYAIYTVPENGDEGFIKNTTLDPSNGDVVLCLFERNDGQQFIIEDKGLEVIAEAIDWSKAPEGAERCNSKIVNTWLKCINGDVYAFQNGEWVRYTSCIGHDDWSNAIKRPSSPTVKIDPTPTNTIDATLDERGERYGKFADGAEIMQALKETMRSAPNWSKLTASQREALEMIQHKIGRALNGDPTYDDNWRDICGYSQLILDELNGVKR
jgi:hypothetical protein